MSAPPGFPRFAKFPVELQIMIWRLILPGPRHIQCHISNGIVSFTGACPPVALHICQISRNLTLPEYKPLFCKDQKQPIYMDLFHDTLVIESYMCEHMAGIYPEVRERIRSLGVRISSEEDFEASVIDIGRSHLKDLEEITLFTQLVGRLSWRGWVEHESLFKRYRLRIMGPNRYSLKGDSKDKTLKCGIYTTARTLGKVGESIYPTRTSFSTCLLVGQRW
ncbi:uncharacterized protein RAG0_02865 [Rhynchosporium agropyri]|uniref:2EXR domain-containing protein n=1 Tax=Rhynchosporium agropyri TaxID=914238 RepID=A0A1E1K2X4_9HELO|nr:uncharacterized protein RAG0_02865 [Rhynchosporium agropyri]